ncbi:MAG: galactose mutarotase [Kiritimatiellae bacterium]|nr:galactose mutarotase [Kiritimatiellia bacterium]
MNSVVRDLALACVTVATLAGCTTNKGRCCKMSECGKSKASVTVSPFGKTKTGLEVKQFHLVGAGGVAMDVIDYGARVVRLWTPDRDGKLADITLGFNQVSGYEDIDLYFGSTIGRFGNRIRDGKFTLDGVTYTIPCNNDPGGIPCTLHGGTSGFNDRVWDSRTLTNGDDVGVEFTMTSPDGDQGYPGKLDVKVTYWLTAKNVWRLEYEAKTDKATPVNLTNHVYFNFHGEGNGTILDHELTLFADYMTPVNAGLIPTGDLAPVKGTPFDFTSPWKIGDRVNTKDNEQIKFGGGYDHNWVLRNQSGKLAAAAALYEKTSGRYMEVWTEEPGIQFYCGNFLTDSVPSKSGGHLTFRGGLALETQHYPDSPNKSSFPSVILRPGQLYKTSTEYRFSTR